MRGATQLATNGFAIRGALVTGTVMKHDTTPRSIGTLDMPARCRSLRMYLRLGFARRELGRWRRRSELGLVLVGEGKRLWP